MQRRCASLNPFSKTLFSLWSNCTISSWGGFTIHYGYSFPTVTNEGIAVEFTWRDGRRKNVASGWDVYSTLYVELDTNGHATSVGSGSMGLSWELPATAVGQLAATPHVFRVSVVSTRTDGTN